MATRNNLCINPKMGVNNTDWTGSVPARATGVTHFTGQPGMAHVDTAGLYTGSSFFGTPSTPASPGATYIASMYFYNATGVAIPGRNVWMAFTRSAGGEDFSALTSWDFPSATTVRRSYSAVAPALATGMRMVVEVDGSAGSGIYVSAVLYEVGSTLAQYFDGDSANATWDGAAENSASTLNDSPTVNPTGFAVPVAFGSPTVRMKVAPSGLAVPVTFGSPTVAGQTYVPPITGGGWSSLLGIVKQARADYAEDLATPPVACPHDGEPLTQARGVRHCRYCGWRYTG